MKTFENIGFIKLEDYPVKSVTMAGSQIKLLQFMNYPAMKKGERAKKGDVKHGCNDF